MVLCIKTIKEMTITTIGKICGLKSASVCTVETKAVMTKLSNIICIKITSKIMPLDLMICLLIKRPKPTKNEINSTGITTPYRLSKDRKKISSSGKEEPHP